MGGLKWKVVAATLAILVAIPCVQAQEAVAPASQAPAYGGDPRARAKIHTELGSMYFQAGNMGVAMQELKIAVAADSAYAPAHMVLALVHAALKENDQAERVFRRAMDLAPGDPEINNNYGWFLCHSGKERQSIAYFLNAVKNPLYSTPDRAYANAGACALKAGDLDGAANYLQTAIRLGGDGALIAQAQLALLAYRRANFEEARRLITEVLKVMEPASADALWLALRIERKLGNRNAESSFAAQLRSRYPNSQEYQEFLKGNFE